jgi:hypothetical protein
MYIEFPGKISKHALAFCDYLINLIQLYCKWRAFFIFRRRNFFSFLEDLFMPINRGLCADSYLIKIFLVIKVNIEVKYYFVAYKQKIGLFLGTIQQFHPGPSNLQTNKRQKL